MHHRLIRLILEIAVPSALELRRRPRPHFRQLLLSWTDFNTCINPISSKGTGALEVPLFEDFLLNVRIPTDEVVKCLGLRLRSEDGKGKVMVLEVETNTGQVDKRLNAGSAKLGRVANARSLQNKRGAECSAADNDLLAGTKDLPWRVGTVEGLGWNSNDSNGPAVLYDNLFDLGIALQMKILVLAPGAVNVAVRRITSTAYDLVAISDTP